MRPINRLAGTTDRAWFRNTRLFLALGRGWQWLTLVDADDPVRLVLNGGFAAIIVILVLAASLLVPVFLISGELSVALVLLITLPIDVFIWWLNRRGLMYGALLLVIWFALGNALGAPPSSYAGST